MGMIRQALTQQQAIEIAWDRPLAGQPPLKQPARPTEAQGTHQPGIQQQALTSELQQPAIGAEIGELHGERAGRSTLLA